MAVDTSINTSDRKLLYAGENASFIDRGVRATRPRPPGNVGTTLQPKSRERLFELAKQR